MTMFQTAAIVALLCAANVKAFLPSISQVKPITTQNPSLRIPTTSRPFRRPTSLRVAATPPDLYAILGISRNAGEDEIKRAYRRLAKLYHPDANPDANAAEKFREVNGAYEILRSPFREKKSSSTAAADPTYSSPFGEDFGKETTASPWSSDFATESSPFGSDFGKETTFYAADETDRFGKGTPFYSADNGFGQETTFGTSYEYGQDVYVGDFFGGSGVSGSDFRSKGRNGSERRAQPYEADQSKKRESIHVGTDLTYELDVDLKTAVLGGKADILIQRVESSEDLVPVSKTVPVNIPAGMENGSKVVIRGGGDAGPKGGPPGDLYIALKVKEDPIFKRKGPEITSVQKISYLDAILGSEIKTPTVDGEVAITVLPGTQSGHTICLQGKGAPSLGNLSLRGNHYVTLKVEIPSDISDKEREDLQVLQKMRKMRDELKSGEKASFKKPSFKSREEELEWEVARLNTQLELERKKSKAQQTEQTQQHETTLKELREQHRQEMNDSTTRLKSAHAKRVRIQKERQELKARLEGLESQSATEIRNLQQATVSLEQELRSIQKEHHDLKAKASKTQPTKQSSERYDAETKALRQAKKCLEEELAKTIKEQLRFLRMEEMDSES